MTRRARARRGAHASQAKREPEHPGQRQTTNAERAGEEQGEKRRGAAQRASEAELIRCSLQENSRYGAILASTAMPAK